MLLILRLLYIEKRKEISLVEEVVIHSQEIHDKFNMLKIDSKANIDKTMFKDTLKTLKRYNIIFNIDNDVTNSEARIKVYPSVLLAVPNDNLNKVFEDTNEKLAYT